MLTARRERTMFPSPDESSPGGSERSEAFIFHHLQAHPLRNVQDPSQGAYAQAQERCYSGLHLPLVRRYQACARILARKARHEPGREAGHYRGEAIGVGAAATCGGEAKGSLSLRRLYEKKEFTSLHWEKDRSHRIASLSAATRQEAQQHVLRAYHATPHSTPPR